MERFIYCYMGGGRYEHRLKEVFLNFVFSPWPGVYFDKECLFFLEMYQCIFHSVIHELLPSSSYLLYFLLMTTTK